MKFLQTFGFDGLMYCLKVSILSDWHPSYFCESALVDHFDSIDSECSKEMVIEMQAFLSNMDETDRHFFTLAAKTLDN